MRYRMVLHVLYVAAVLLSSGLGIAVAVWLYTDDAAVSTRLFVAFVALHSVVGFFVVGQLLAPDGAAIPIYSAQKALAAGIMPLWFLFAVTYTSRLNELSRPVMVGVGVYYVGLAVLEMTNPLHMLLWSSYETTGSMIPHLYGNPTALYTVLTLPLAVFYFTGLGLVGVHALNGPAVRRRQSAYLFVSYVPPFFVLNPGIYRVLPGPIDGGLVIVSTLSLATVGWAVFRHRLFDLIPLARETVFQAVEEPVIVVDEDLRVLDYNAAAVATFPHLDGEEGGSLADRVPALLDAEGADTPFASSLTHENDDGVRHYDVRISTLDVRGQTRGYGLVLQDVTENRKHIHRLQQETERLERFASTLSHDIRNPLNVAEGRVQLALKTGDLDHLEDVTRAHERIKHIIEDLLQLAQEGRRIEDPDQLCVAEVFESAWRTTDTKGATCNVEDGADFVTYGDQTRLQRAFENLIRNAVEHGSQVGERVSGDAAGDDAGDMTVTFSRHADGFYIEDDGCGVAPDQRERVFEYEYTTTEQGTGLGLALVDEIAQAHGWHIEMNEGADGGARIVFSNVEPVEKAQPSS